MNSRKKKTKTTTGISRRLVFALPLGLVAESPYAVVAGTVFRETGHAFPGIEVVLNPLSPSKKNKKQSVRTNTRGEYSFRVPAATVEYSLSVAVEGYRPETKSVKITGDERIEQNFLLDRVK